MKNILKGQRTRKEHENSEYSLKAHKKEAFLISLKGVKKERKSWPRPYFISSLFPF